MDLFDIKGHKAIVTGGASGLAHGMAEGLLEEGAEVVIFDISKELPDIVADFKARGFKAHGVVVDLMDQEQRVEAFHEALNVLGNHLDILVPAAGIQRRSQAEKFPLKDWHDVIEVNLTAIFVLCQLAGNVMLSQEYGKIINIASMLSFFGGITIPAYAASKGGVAQLTKALSNEWASKGINVNAIAPGYMNTQMNERLLADPKRYESITSRIPARRWGEPEDMKGVVVFLASHASDYISGAIIPVDGGYLGF